MPQSPLTIIIVNYNTADDLHNCLTSIYRQSKAFTPKIIVVDNASRDTSLAMLRRDFKKVHVIANKNNRGFAAANNQALRKCTTRYILLLNPDTIIKSRAIEKTLAYFEQHPKAGIVGCRVVGENGHVQSACHRGEPTALNSLFHVLKFDRLFRGINLFTGYALTHLDESKNHLVGAVSGSFLMIRRSIIQQVGLLDETFFMYGEELDWCYRVRIAGAEVHYFAGAEILHKKGTASRKNFHAANKAFYNAMLLYHTKHYKQRTFFLCNILIYIGVKTLYLLSLLRGLIQRRVGTKD